MPKISVVTHQEGTRGITPIHHRQPLPIAGRCDSRPGVQLLEPCKITAPSAIQNHWTTVCGSSSGGEDAVSGEWGSDRVQYQNFVTKPLPPSNLPLSKLSKSHFAHRPRSQTEQRCHTAVAAIGGFLLRATCEASCGSDTRGSAHLERDVSA